MKIEVLYFDGCPHHAAAVERVRFLMTEEGIGAELQEIEVTGPGADVTGFLGSPTIRIDGVDIDPGARAGSSAGLACRVYAGGLPSEDMVRAALREARSR